MANQKSKTKTVSVRIEVPVPLHNEMMRIKGLKTYQDKRKYSNNDIYLLAAERLVRSDVR